ncbi:MAG TPA: tetratricopeptide repeat protein, partial [Stellaceae bacterium]|nr:tetratricopeptide repeat protein [Stellaceae bacterium]
MAARTLKTAALLLGLVAFAGAAAANDYLDDAKRLIAKGDLRAARIQLKNAVQAEPQNMEAHYRLGGVYLGLGDATA